MNRRQFLTGSSAAAIAAGCGAPASVILKAADLGKSEGRNWLVLYESTPGTDSWLARTFFDVTDWPEQQWYAGWAQTKRFVGITQGELVERLENENKARKVVFPSRRIGKTAAIGDSWKSLSESDRVAPALANRQTQPGEV